MMKIKFILIFLFFSLTFLNAQSVSINFSSTDTVHNMSGFVHGMDDTYPHDSLITPLQPAYWRGGVYLSATGLQSFYLRATGFNAKYILVLGDIWGYPPDWSTAPYNDTVAFKNFVDTVCNGTSGYPMIYDIWGEPNGAGWIGTQSQFFNTFKMAHDRIRLNLGNSVEVSGPSIWWADTTYLRNFCDYCLANNIQLDVLSFHWFTDDTYTFLLKDVLLWCRSEFMNDPHYAPLQIKKIMVNEVVPENGQYAPGFVMAHYYYMEQGKADGACRSCWNNCWDNTLEGLLTPGTNQRRSQWWATKIYAEMDSVRFVSTSSNAKVYAMSGKLDSQPNTIRTMIGYYQNISTSTNINVTLTLNNLNSLGNFPSSDSIYLNVFKIPNSGDNPLVQPVSLGSFSMMNNTSSIVLPSYQLDTNSILYFDITSASNTIGIENIYSECTKVYPNPANDLINIELPNYNEEEYIMEICDINGKIVKQTYLKNQKTSFSIRDLTSGTYMYRVRAGSEIHFSGKMMIE